MDIQENGELNQDHFSLSSNGEGKILVPFLWRSGICTSAAHLRAPHIPRTELRSLSPHKCVLVA